jgi:hypothetical protein
MRIRRSLSSLLTASFCLVSRVFLLSGCGNVAAILELDEKCEQSFKIFEAAPQDARGIPQKSPGADYFL